MPIPIAAMAAMSGAGGLMGAKQAKQNSQPTKQWTDPWRGGDANWFMDQSKGAASDALGIDWGPSDDQKWMYERMKQGAFGGGGGGGGGGGESMYGSWKRKGGGGGGGNKNAKYAKNNVDYSDYEKRVTDASYMDVTNDPYLRAQQEYRRGLHDENSAMSRSQALTPFAGSAATMGFTGANLDTQSRMQQANERDWLGMENEMFMGERNARRGEAMGANQAWSGRESAYDSSAMSADAQRAAAAAAARASMYGADQRLRGVMAGVGAQNNALNWGKQMDMYGISGGMADMMRQNQGLGRMGVMQQYGNMTQPWQQGFGTSYNQGPKQSSMGGFLSGAMSGAMSGLSLGGGKVGGMGMFKNLFGGGGGGGGGAPYVGPQPMYYPSGAPNMAAG